MMYSENGKSRMFCCLQTVSLVWQGEIMHNRERQRGFENFICFEQNAFEDDRYLLFLLLTYIYIYLGKPTNVLEIIII